MSISSQRATEAQREAYTNLVNLFAAYESHRVRKPLNSASITYSDVLLAQYHGALDSYVIFMGANGNEVHDDVMESYQARIESMS